MDSRANNSTLVREIQASSRVPAGQSTPTTGAHHRNPECGLINTINKALLTVLIRPY